MPPEKTEIRPQAPSFVGYWLRWHRLAAPVYGSASAARAQFCSINSIALARTRSSLFSKARINGSSAPGGAVCTHLSNARNLVPISGDSRSLAIQAGTTRGSSASAGLEEETGTDWGPCPPGAVPFPEARPTSLPDATGTEVAAWVTGGISLLLGNELCLERAASLPLARDTEFGELSDDAGPQLASPARNIRLRSGVRHDLSRDRECRDGSTARC